MLKEKLNWNEINVSDLVVNTMEALVNRTSGRIFLFGAGKGGEDTYSFIRKNTVFEGEICGFIDNNPLKQGTVFCGLNVYSLSEFKQIYNNDAVIISCGEGDVIKKQLKENGVLLQNVYIPDISSISVNDYEFICNNIEEFTWLYGALEDNQSKKVLVNLLNYKLTHDMRLLSEIAEPPEKQYFDERLIKYSMDDVFLDCGGYIGDTIESYIEHNKGIYSKIITFEAEEKNAEIIKRKYKNENIKVYPIALWNKKAEISFDNKGSGSGCVLDVNEGKNSERVKCILADTIDDIIGNEKVSFIKMDIEGAEYKALCGGIDTICRCRPTLMISCYHKQDDYIRLAHLIKSLNSNYKLYMRHYRAESIQETVLYALNK